MNRGLRPIKFLLSALVIVAILSSSCLAQFSSKRTVPDLRAGLSPEEVITLWGPPSEKSELGPRHRDLWSYEFGIVLFENGSLIEWTPQAPRVSEAITISAPAEKTSTKEPVAKLTRDFWSTLAGASTEKGGISSPLVNSSPLTNPKLPNSNRFGAPVPPIPEEPSIPPPDATTPLTGFIDPKTLTEEEADMVRQVEAEITKLDTLRREQGQMDQQ